VHEILTNRELALDYISGSLTGLERAEVTRARLSDPELDAEIRLAEAQFAPLTGKAGEVKTSAGLFDRIARAIDAEQTGLAGMSAIACADGDWQPYLPGIELKQMWNASTKLLRCQPGAILPAHDHVRNEHIIVISGDFMIGGRSFTTGDYHRAPAGISHGDAHTRGGCILLVQYADA
jgi:hypothetical protein